MMEKRRRSTKAQIEAVDEAILEVAEIEQPVTVRGVFYRVMSRGLVPKSEKGYGQVQRRVLELRRNGRLPYGWITDGSRNRLEVQAYDKMSAALWDTAQCYRRTLWRDQGVHVEVWSEKDAIRGVLWPVTADWDVPLLISRGFASETFVWESAQAVNNCGHDRAVIYQCGDHDPSGVAAWEDTQRKLLRFINPWIDVRFERLAVTPEQIVDMQLPTRPTKKSDTRAANFEGESVEVDAIPSSVLRRIVGDAIESHVDGDRLEMTKRVEQQERRLLFDIAGKFDHS